ncbi:MAG: aminotransferase class III-fold pyridoxal phosphate-dependent enzyme [Phycisphaerales bacterium]|nr:MAG: aminotransferase class III-fold pyridoxal phosphate-dependent enzyme [Phycisphaerales bacterium]
MLRIKQHEQRSPGDGHWLGPAPWIETPPPGPRAQAIIERDRKVASLDRHRLHPLVASRAYGSVIEDVDGNRYLDFAAGPATFAAGHAHPKVVAAVERQARCLIHVSGSDFYVGRRTRLSERLASLAPGDLPKHVLLANGGTESIEAAVKLARWFTGRPWLVTFTGSFHGWTLGAMALSSSKLGPRHGFGPLLPKVAHLAYGESDAVEERLSAKHVDPDDVAAVIVEPIQTTDAFVVPPPSFLPALRDLCNRHGILLIVDEIRTGMGRTGRMFACEHVAVVPDVIVLGLALGSGMPLGAVIADARVMTAASGALADMPGGNPVSCAAAEATLDLLEQSYASNAECLGRRLRDDLERLADRHRCLGNVGGLGLLSVVDIVKGGSIASPKLRDRILLEAFGRGLLLLKCGPSSIRFSPPLSINETQVDVALHVFEESVNTVT